MFIRPVFINSRPHRTLQRFFCTKSNHNEKLKEIVCNYTGVSPNEAFYFIQKNKLQNRNPDVMIDSFEMYTKLGFNMQDFLKNGSFFRFYSNEHHQHYLLMEEGGFTNYMPEAILTARTLLREQITTLKDYGYIKQDVNVFESFLSYINEDFHKIVKLNYSDDMSWRLLHTTIAKQYLAWRLEVKEKDIIELYETHPATTSRSFRVMEQNISFAESLGLSKRRIIKCGYIIRAYPVYAKQTLEEFPTLAGYDMRLAMKNNPTLIVAPTRRIKQTYEVLKEFRIPDKSIQTAMGIFQLAPETVRARLEEIQSSPDTAPLLKIPRLLNHLIYHSRAKTRLTFLQHMKLRCINFKVLLDSSEDLELYIREGKDINCKQDLYAYLKNLLDVKDSKDLADKISRHPNYLNVPLKDIGTSFKYLLGCGFWKANIYEAIWILLYPADIIKFSLSQLKSDSSISFKMMNQVQKLNTILYTIEKDHHFTGQGVFKNINCDFEEQTVK